MKILLGNAYNLIRDLPDKSIDCIYTDPPYEFDKMGGYSETASEIKKQIIKSFGDLQKNEIVDGFDYKILDDFVRVSKKVNIFIWCSKKQIPKLLDYFKNYNFDILVWCKTQAIPMTNNTWLSDIEYCLYFREKGVKLNDGYELKSKWYSSALMQREKKQFKHPTVKPLELVERHLKHACQPGYVVLDPFLGSGTTAVACKKLGLEFIGFELNKQHYETAMNRIKGITAQENEAGFQSIFDLFDIKEEKFNITERQYKVIKERLNENNK